MMEVQSGRSVSAVRGSGTTGTPHPPRLDRFRIVRRFTTALTAVPATPNAAQRAPGPSTRKCSEPGSLPPPPRPGSPTETARLQRLLNRHPLPPELPGPVPLAAAGRRIASYNARYGSNQ